MTLAELGWNDDFRAKYAEWASKTDVRPGRVAIEFNQIFRIYLEGDELDAVTAGRVKHRAKNRAELPAVGDWVVVRQRAEEDGAVIVAVLPRRSAFTRRGAGNVTGEQVVAANVDVVFVVMGLDADYNLRRLERYLLMARESGASPVILLTKPDLCADVPAHRPGGRAGGRRPAGARAPAEAGRRHRARSGRISVQASPRRCWDPRASARARSSTGSSDPTPSARARCAESDSRGRHTTTHRELVMLPGGGLIIDTPGMRELQLWDAAGAVRETFEEIEALAAGCHFTDCRHRDEPRCAVKAAIADGQVSAERLESYLKLQDELTGLAKQQDERAELDEKRRGKPRRR